MEKFLNPGCGARICSDPRWVHVDFVSSHNRVIGHNLLEGIPFPDASFDVVYNKGSRLTIAMINPVAGSPSR